MIEIIIGRAVLKFKIANSRLKNTETKDILGDKKLQGKVKKSKILRGIKSSTKTKQKQKITNVTLHNKPPRQTTQSITLLFTRQGIQSRRKQRDDCKTGFVQFRSIIETDYPPH